MTHYETARLSLRSYEDGDFAAVHAYASDPDILTYMLWGPNSETDTRAFIALAKSTAAELPRRRYELAVTEKASGELIGGGLLILDGADSGEIGWILRRDKQRRGYGSEIGQFLVELGFGGLGLRRLIARCDAENTPSRRVMERIGMRREGLFIEARPAHKKSARRYSDEYAYAILRREWDGVVAYKTRSLEE